MIRIIIDDNKEVDIKTTKGLEEVAKKFESSECLKVCISKH